MIKNRKVILCGFFIPFESLILDHMKKLIFFIIVLLYSSVGYNQTLSLPNYAVASHPMIVERIHSTSNHLIFDLVVENKSAVGNFCANKNIFIRDLSENKKIQLSYSKGIPICPDSYQFKYIGEKLRFQLYFPKPDHHLKYLDLIEDCNEACFSIHGLILDLKMNQMIEDAFKQFEQSDYNSSEITLKKIMSEYADYPYGFLYLNLIQVLVVEGKDEEAKKYYQTILNSNYSDKNFIIDQLKKLGLFSN